MTSIYTPGRIIGGRYRITSALSQGGMGAVYLAQQISLGRDVALKVILEREHDPELVKRFDVEARAVCLLKHPNIITYHDYGRDEEGHPYLVMEFLPGYPGTKLVYGERRPGLRDLAHVVAQMCSALHESHSKGIVHRDLKWSNVMICPQSHDPLFAKLIDFGIIKVAQSDGSTGSSDKRGLTVTGVLIGTPEYMSPEAICGMPIDGRADQYSLGVMLWEALEGTRPFQAPTQFELLRQQVQDEPPPFIAARRVMDEHPQLEPVILKAIEKHPDDRFDTILELRDRLLAAVGAATPRGAALAPLPAAPRRDAGAATRPRTLQPVPKSARMTNPLGAGAASSEPAPVVTGHRTGREARADLAPRRRSRVRLFAGVGLGAAAIAAAVTLAATSSGSSPDTSGAVASALVGADAPVVAATDVFDDAATLALGDTARAPEPPATQAPAAAAVTPPIPTVAAPSEPDVTEGQPDVAVVVAEPEPDAAPTIAAATAEPDARGSPTAARPVARAADARPPATAVKPPLAAAGELGEARFGSSTSAEITVNGQKRGWTPLTVSLPAGTYRVQYRFKDALDEWHSATIKVVAGQPTALSLHKEPKPQ